MKLFIIGCGRILPKHLDSLKLIGKKSFELVGIADIDEKKKNFFTKKLKIQGFTNYKQGINKTNPEVVSILTPSGNHAKNIVDVLNLKKHVIVEKPMCLKSSDAQKIISLSRSVKKKVFVVMQNKFNLPILKLREDIKKKKFGKVFHASVIVRWKRDQQYYDQDKWRGTWKLDGGVVSNQASHHLDLMRTIMGNPVSVYAKFAKHLAKIQCEDTALIILNFRNKKTAIMEATTAMRPKNIEGSLSILGTKGSAKIGGFALNEIVYYNIKKKIQLAKYKTNPKSVYGFGHYHFYCHVFECLMKNKKSEFEVKEASKTVNLINAIYKSASTGKEIFLNKINVSSKLGT